MTHNSLSDSKNQMAVAEKIIELVHAELPGQFSNQYDALWLAFQALYSPRGACIQLESYGFNRSHSKS